MQDYLQALLKMNETINSYLPFWNQGQGGNISLKSESIIAIKPTGFRLDQLRGWDDFATLNFLDFAIELKNLAQSSSSTLLYEKAYSDLIAQARDRSGSAHRASMEVGFHIFLPATYVCHFHHLNSVLLAELIDQGNAKDFLIKWGHDLAVVPYIRPGWELTQYFINNSVRAPIILMRNHGLLLQMNGLADFRRFEEFDKDLKKFLGEVLAADLHQKEREVKERDITAPFRFYFPDLAIFEEKLKSFLKSEGNEFSMDYDRQPPLDMIENWQAIVYLSQLMPQLSTLSPDEVEELKTTPTELARMREIAKGVKA
ncbi:MAG: class II aldolase/adducin family protein [Bdellovibrionales bacterium]|nr:class II aldolase/adducin family protein [Bdellovibrionales bacterium]